MSILCMSLQLFLSYKNFCTHFTIWLWLVCKRFYKLCKGWKFIFKMFITKVKRGPINLLFISVCLWKNQIELYLLLFYKYPSVCELHNQEIRLKYGKMQNSVFFYRLFQKWPQSASLHGHIVSIWYHFLHWGWPTGRGK